MESVQSHEERINRSSEKSIEKAFQARGNIFKEKRVPLIRKVRTLLEEEEEEKKHTEES